MVQRVSRVCAESAGTAKLKISISSTSRKPHLIIMSGILFEDMFNVESVDSARYNKVSRIIAQSSTSQDIKITLDINSELFQVRDHDSLTITLASSLGNE